MQSEKPKEEWLYKGTGDCFGKIMKEEGFTAFFKGAGANALRTVGSALVLVLYGEIKQAMAVRPRPAIRCLVRPPRSHRQ